MHKQTRRLQAFYDAKAQDFSDTRKKPWPEFDYIIKALKQQFSPSDKFRVLELGCGDGRLLEHLQKTFPHISYTGVDISYNLLAIANANHPTARWVHKDMVSFLGEAEQETYDCIIAIASFHHLPHEPARLEALNGMYQSLSYDGISIMTNRCYSDRFKKKYKKEITQARRKVLWSLGYSDRHDIMVPRKGEDKTYHRLYHIFSPEELTRLIQRTGFTNISHIYLDTTGKETVHEEEGRNLITTMTKSIYQEE